MTSSNINEYLLRCLVEAEVELIEADENVKAREAEVEYHKDYTAKLRAALEIFGVDVDEAKREFQQRQS